MKANEILGLLSHFNSLVRSKLEYVFLIWSPHLKCEIHLLERGYEIFEKRLVYREDGAYPLRGNDYKNVCVRFKMLTIQKRHFFVSFFFIQVT